MRLLILIPIAAMLLVSGCDSHEAGTFSLSDVQAVQAAAIDISGDWDYEVEVRLVFPGFVAPDFGYEPEGPTLHLSCTGSGTFEIVQDGSSYTSVSNQAEASCQTLGGQLGPAPWPPGPATSTGTISGRSLHYAADPDPAGISCSGNGVVKEVAGGMATEIHLRGGCDLSPLPFNPAQAKNAYVLTRR
jgi:hypothetical protein